MDEALSAVMRQARMYMPGENVIIVESAIENITSPGHFVWGFLFCRCTQVVKGSVCKTELRGFDSHH